MYEIFCILRDLGAIAQVHAENGDIIEEVPCLCSLKPKGDQGPGGGESLPLPLPLQGELMSQSLGGRGFMGPCVATCAGRGTCRRIRVSCGIIRVLMDLPKKHFGGS